MKLKHFVFSPFQVNTYILYDDTGKCAIIDPGCHESDEEQELLSFLEENSLSPVLLINTHSHIDHVLGNNFIYSRFNLKPQIHEAGLRFLENAPDYAKMFGIKLEKQVLPEKYLKHGEIIMFGNSSLEVAYTPGHVDGSISLISRPDKFVITGDVLFYESIGRTDLPSGNFQTLLQSIQTCLFTLPDDFFVYSGHGHETTIGHEKRYNPFLIDID